MEEKPLESVRDVMSNVVNYLPTLLAGFIVLLLGAVAAWIVVETGGADFDFPPRWTVSSCGWAGAGRWKRVTCGIRCSGFWACWRAC